MSEKNRRRRGGRKGEHEMSGLTPPATSEVRRFWSERSQPGGGNSVQRVGPHYAGSHHLKGRRHG